MDVPNQNSPNVKKIFSSLCTDFQTTSKGRGHLGGIPTPSCFLVQPQAWSKPPFTKTKTPGQCTNKFIVFLHFDASVPLSKGCPKTINVRPLLVSICIFFVCLCKSQATFPYPAMQKLSLKRAKACSQRHALKIRPNHLSLAAELSGTGYVPHVRNMNACIDSNPLAKHLKEGPVTIPVVLLEVVAQHWQTVRMRVSQSIGRSISYRAITCFRCDTLSL